MITVNPNPRRLVSGHWQVNVEGNDGVTHLLKMPGTKDAPLAADVREIVRVLEVRRAEERRLDVEERVRVQALQARVRGFRQGTLTNAQTKDLLTDLLGELRDALKG